MHCNAILVNEKCNFHYRNVYWECHSVTPRPFLHVTPKTMIFLIPSLILSKHTKKIE